MNKLLDYISKKAIELSKIKIPDKKEAEFFSKFLSIYNANIFDTYKGISNVGYVAAVLRINDIPLEFEEFWELIKNVANVFDNPKLDVSVLELYFKTLKKLNDDGVLKDCSPNTIDLDSETLQQYKNNDLQNLDHFICSCDKNGHYDIIASESLIRLFKLKLFS